MQNNVSNDNNSSNDKNYSENVSKNEQSIDCENNITTAVITDNHRSNYNNSNLDDDKNDNNNNNSNFFKKGLQLVNDCSFSVNDLPLQNEKKLIITNDDSCHNINAITNVKSKQ